MAIDPRRIEVIDDDTAAALRRMTIAEKLEFAAEARLKVRKPLLEKAQIEHPEWPIARVQLEVSLLTSEPAIFTCGKTLSRPSFLIFHWNTAAATPFERAVARGICLLIREADLVG